MDKIILKSISDLNSWFESPEMAFIALNGGWELTVRDRLLFSIQQNMPKCFIKSEHNPYDKKRADIAVVQNGKTTALIELKSNFSFQLNEITGAGLLDWEKSKFDLPKNRKLSRIEKEQQKWESDLKINNILLYGIHIVAHIENLSDDLKEDCYCKYPGIYKSNSADFNKAVKAYFESLTDEKSAVGWRLIEIYKVTATCKSPHAVTASLDFYILKFRI